MFFTSKQKKELGDKHNELEDMILRLRSRVSHLEDIVEKLSTPAPYGRCKDGTPRAKPGMKTGQKKAVKK